MNKKIAVMRTRSNEDGSDLAAIELVEPEGWTPDDRGIVLLTLPHSGRPDRFGRVLSEMITWLKTHVRRELTFFRDAPLLAVIPDKEISVLVGAGSHLYVQATHWPHRSRQEQEVETANTLLRAAQMMAVSAGAVMVQHGPAPATETEGGPPNG